MLASLKNWPEEAYVSSLMIAASYEISHRKRRIATFRRNLGIFGGQRGAAIDGCFSLRARWKVSQKGDDKGVATTLECQAADQ